MSTMERTAGIAIADIPLFLFGLLSKLYCATYVFKLVQFQLQDQQVFVGSLFPQ